MRPSPSGRRLQSCSDHTLTLTTHHYGNEISWDIDGTIDSGSAYSNYEQYTQVVCLTTGLHTLNCHAAYGDGWHGASVSVASSSNLCASFSSGELASVTFAVGTLPASPPPPSPVPQAAANTSCLPADELSGRSARHNYTTRGARCATTNMTGTAADYATCDVVRLELPANGLAGVLTEDLCQLPALQVLDLADNELGGEIPICLVDWADARGRQLFLANNAMQAPSQGMARRISRLCTTSLACSGLPPDECSAFGPRRHVPSVDGTFCIECPDSILVPALVAAFVMAVLLIWVGSMSVRNNVHKVRRYGATAIIFVNHAQVLALIISLQLEWPPSIKKLLSVLELDFFAFVPPECEISNKWLIAYTPAAIITLLLLALWVLKAVRGSERPLFFFFACCFTQVGRARIPTPAPEAVSTPAILYLHTAALSTPMHV